MEIAMPLPEQTTYNKHFYEQLGQIRAKIETLPEEKRPGFRRLADQAEEHHRSMSADCARVWEVVDDMRLNQAAVEFDVWSTAREIKQMFR
jgi:hypothetical protein